MCVMCPEGTFSYGTRAEALRRKPPRPFVIKGIGVPFRGGPHGSPPPKRDPDDEVYPPQQNPKPISLQWEDIEYKPPTY